MKTITDQLDKPLSFEEEPDQPEIWWRETVRMFCTNKAAVGGFIGLIIIIMVGLFGPVFFEADPFAIIGRPLTEPVKYRFWEPITWGAMYLPGSFTGYELRWRLQLPPPPLPCLSEFPSALWRDSTAVKSTTP